MMGPVNRWDLVGCGIGETKKKLFEPGFHINIFIYVLCNKIRRLNIDQLGGLVSANDKGKN